MHGFLCNLLARRFAVSVFMEFLNFLRQQQMETTRDRKKEISCIDRWVIKLGSSTVTEQGRGINPETLASWARQIAQLQRAGKQIILVSSGAVAIGIKTLGWSARPKELPNLQTAAAVGQMQLASSWQQAFARENIAVAQILLTHDDARDRRRYLNIRATLQTACNAGIVPVINENDTVSFDEIRFGDNDNLGAMVANIVSAGGYIILTDQRGLFDKNPREFPNAKFLSQIAADDPRLPKMAGKTGGILGSGGMYSKITAAQKAARSGTHTLIASGVEAEIIKKLTDGEEIGSWLIAPSDAQAARKQWLGSQLQISGRLFLDDGAVDALINRNSSLLPIGVKKVEGEFMRGELLACVDKNGEEIARGLSNYEACDCREFAGKHSSELAELLIHGENLIHRDNLVIVK